MKATRLTDTRGQLGESPVWDFASGRLVWLDVPGKALFSTDPASGDTSRRDLPRQIHSVRPIGDGSWVATSGLGIWHLTTEDGMALLAEVNEPVEGGFNDASVDPAGRLWTGTATSGPEAKGALYRFDGERCDLVSPGIVMSNGLGWSPDTRSMYYSDSAANRVYVFDYDLASGSASNRRDLIVLPEGQLPDGLAVDTDGNVWVAVWGGSAVLCVSPEGREVSRIELPTSNVTSCAFGGEGYRTLYITTAASDPEPDDGIGGALFYAVTNARGTAPVNFNMGKVR